MNEVVQTDFELNISDNAVSHFLSVMNQNGIPSNYALRIAVTGSRHEGFSYSLGFDCNPSTDDTVIEKDSLVIFIDKKSIPNLTGAKIDYVQTPDEEGFVFHNPNAENRCTCND